jgi:predicted hotdog family 3-hydroxylacyl-ACP dehydratase
MVFVDAMVEADVARAVCTLAITEQTACLRAGRLPAVYVVEAMAQAVAAHLGLLARWYGEPPVGGYLVAVRDVVLGCADFAPGDALAIEVEHAFLSERFASYACRVRRDDVDVASATLNVLRNDA